MELINDMLGNPNIIQPLNRFFYFIRDKRVLIIGAGGGGDACGCLATYHWIKECGGIPIIGSLTWERTDGLQEFGPRPFEQIEGLSRAIGTVAWGSEKTVSKSDGKPFQASRLSQHIHEPVVYLDISKGVQPVSKDLTEFCKVNDIYFIIPLDVGGDILGRGKEPGLRTPLADSMTLAIIAQIKIPKALGIYGLNCDGELTLAELNDYIQEFNLKNWVYGAHTHTDEEFTFMEKVIQESKAVTEASWQPIRYWHGERGTVGIRKDKRKVQLDEIVIKTFFFRLDEIYEQCPLAKALYNTTSIVEANEILLNKYQLISEYEAEKRKVIKTPIN